VERKENMAMVTLSLRQVNNLSH